MQIFVKQFLEKKKKRNLDASPNSAFPCVTLDTLILTLKGSRAFAVLQNIL
jgi:hypothetical protein